MRRIAIVIVLLNLCKEGFRIFNRRPFVAIQKIWRARAACKASEIDSYAELPDQSSGSKSSYKVKRCCETIASGNGTFAVGGEIDARAIL